MCALKYCNGCQTEKPRSEFGIRNRRRGWLNSRCKECASAAQRARIHEPWYLDYRNKRNEEVRQRALQTLGGRCVGCGDERLLALEFDHIEGLQGEARLAGLAFYYRIIRDVEYRAKLQVLCGSCHNIKTRGGELPSNTSMS